MKLSILVPTTHTRRNTFLPKILDQLYSQYDKLRYPQQQEVEILVLQDNKTIMLGSKRNELIRLAQGDYVVFVDDDDRLSPDYISTLLNATEHNTDVITFKASVSLSGEQPKECVYTSRIQSDYNTETTYYRLPNHICCFKRDLALLFPFPNILYGEDSGFSKSIKNAIKTEHHIPETLYYYDYNQETTETQQHLGSNSNAVIDIVILSNASNNAFKMMTQNAINSAFNTCDGLPINIIVVEQNQNITYSKVTTHHETQSFNYNKFANIGASLGKSKRIMISNNDVIFQKCWLRELMLVDYPLMSPHERRDIRQRDIIQDTKGQVTGKHFSGWCFCISRDLWLDIGGFDEDFNFWFADDSVIQQCVQKGIEPMLVKKSLVDHLGSQTFKQLDNKTKDDYTWGLTDLFNKKYNQNKFHDHPQFKQWKILKSQSQQETDQTN